MTRAWIPCALVLGLALAGCTTTELERDADRARGAQPSLEDIFLLPGMQGATPRVGSISADGACLLVEWRALERDAAGARKLAASSGAYLLASDGEALTPRADSSLLAHLERQERARHEQGGPRLVGDLQDWKPAAPGATAWSHRGHRLALAWERGIVVWTPPPVPDGALSNAAGSVLYCDPAPSDGEEDVRQQSDERPAWRELPRRLGKIESLEFGDDDRELVVRTATELFVFPLDEPQRWPLALADAAWPTRELEPALRGVQLSRDRTRAFSQGRPVGKLQRPGADGRPIEVDAQFLDITSGRAVALEGMQTGERMERVSLSPDGSFVAGAEVDRSGLPAPTLVPDYLTERVTTRDGRRELADDTWPPQALWIWSTADGTRRRIELPGEREFVCRPIGWAPQGAPRWAFRRTSSDYRTRETWVWDASGPQLAFTERDPHWIGGPNGAASWSRDGQRILFASECVPVSSTPDRCQVFALDSRTGALTQLTEVEGEVSRWFELADGSLVVQASRDDPARREIAHVTLTPEPRTRWLALPAGFNDDLEVAEQGGLVAYVHQELGVPGELYVSSIESAEAAHRLTRTIPDDYAGRDWIRPERLQLRHPDGTTIRAHVYLPRASRLTAPDRPRACVVFIHGAGYLQNVTDSMTEYAVNLMFHSRLASMGYVVADVDYRGSAGYGAKFRGEVQFQLGKLELEDIGVVTDELARRGVIDAARVGCYGGSYGGFLTLMALFTEPERWSCGAALRSVTDWRTYHPGYTQPRLGRPSTHAEAYARSSPIDLAQNLEDPLLILHGMVDTNVFAQDSIRLMEKLIDRGLDFDAMLYPSQGHGFSDGMHWLDEYRRIERFLVRHLGRP